MSIYLLIEIFYGYLLERFVDLESTNMIFYCKEIELKSI
jgi:hypothetical protein